MHKTLNTSKGFTLLEILLVVAIISILAGIVIVAINPAKQLGDARNAQRRSDVLTILNAVWQYDIDNGTFPASINSGSPVVQANYTSASSTCNLSVITSTAREVCKDTSTACVSAVDLKAYLATTTSNATYITQIPTDPLATSTGQGSGYYIAKLTGSNGDASPRIIVCAPLTENQTQSSGMIGVAR